MSSATILDVAEANFSSDVLHSSLPVLVDFWAPWCGPCRLIAPVLDEIACERQGIARIAKVNVDEAPELARRFGVRLAPTFLYFQGGEVRDKIVGGATTKKELLAKLDALIDRPGA